MIFVMVKKGTYEQEEFWLVVDLWMGHIRRIRLSISDADESC